MLVDLARNDVNRVCDPLTTRVDKLMVVQKVCYPSLQCRDCATTARGADFPSFRMYST
jgi:hypothetical protein